MERKPFGVTRDGRAVEEIVLDNGKLRCSLLTYGASLRGLIVPGAAGPVDVALGFESMEAYETQDKFMGAVVGRYANRIGGKTYDYMPPLIGIACIYLFFVVILTWLQGKLERRLGQSDRR